MSYCFAVVRDPRLHSASTYHCLTSLSYGLTVIYYLFIEAFLLASGIKGANDLNCFFFALFASVFTPSALVWRSYLPNINMIWGASLLNQALYINALYIITLLIQSIPLIVTYLQNFEYTSVCFLRLLLILFSCFMYPRSGVTPDWLRIYFDVGIKWLMVLVCAYLTFILIVL